MPNWCSTEIEIYHDDKKAIDSLYHKIKEWTSRDYMENGAGNYNWLGNVVLGSGVGTVDQNKDTDIRCRGEITLFGKYDGCISISTETAWVPMLQMWLKVIDKYIPGGRLFYEAFEPGCEICCTNNVDIVGMYFLDFYDETDCVFETFSKSYLISFLQDKCKAKNISDIDALRNMCEENCDHISIYKWEYVPAEEWN